ncbi:hypothetical protein GS597_17290 [Synechococcales cyanobacterium C]|uniref:Uncharacterized protein n=1 Tax=Petrachloros mirabilis ULC683 TaxID=2781853 RepID=A0A8K2A9F8_9CYAN|nr:hypothetical protein [Petrachloros mirabilis]NCJ08229.1 hypothetical protein [Petrachloros mirabilis ULC683]
MRYSGSHLSEVRQDASVQQILLMSQLRDVEARLDGVGVVRSPYDGTIKKIKWLSQTDQDLLTEVTITSIPDRKN